MWLQGEYVARKAVRGVANYYYEIMISGKGAAEVYADMNGGKFNCVEVYQRYSEV